MESGSKTQSKSKVTRPPTVEEATRRHRLAEESLARKTRLLKDLLDVGSRNVPRLPEGEYGRALEAAKEEFGVAAAMYADATDELNAVCDALE